MRSLWLPAAILFCVWALIVPAGASRATVAAVILRRWVIDSLLPLRVSYNWGTISISRLMSMAGAE